MCLLIVLAQQRDDLPLVVAANRDELLERPAIPMTVLREAGPRILGGRDEQAGGTWLAVNEAGVVAALTNRPVKGERDPTKRSRGELPLMLARHTSAAAAVDAFAARPADYNPAWLLVGDRDALYAVDLAGDDEPVVERLGPGVHILENRPLGAESPKVDRVRSLLTGVGRISDEALIPRLHAALSDHQVPELSPADAEELGEFPVEVRAACVHTERYGTRWSAVITVPRSTAQPPVFHYADGQPCQAPFEDASSLWSGAVLPSTDPPTQERVP